MTDIHQALDRFLAREPEVPFDLHDSLKVIIAAARAHADWLESFPSDEDVEVAARAAHKDDSTVEWEDAAFAIQGLHRRWARAALQAIADARRTEEEES